MYLAYYQMAAKPFQIDTDPGFLWLGSDHREALAHLKYGLLENNGYVVLVGHAGTGKTTLINALLKTLDERVLVANVNYPRLDATEFLTFVARTYDPEASVAGKADCLLFFRDFLERARADGKRVLLLIDEAHRLSDTMLEEIRLLSNLEHDGEKLINIFFVGQRELARRLRSIDSQALRQRITLFYHLKPLSEPDTLQYIIHRLKVAGCNLNPFTPQAVHAVFKFSQGYPRLINTICDRALLTGYVKELRAIDAAVITECAKEIGLIDPVAGAWSILRSRWGSGHNSQEPPQEPVSPSHTQTRFKTALKQLATATLSKGVTLFSAAAHQMRKGYAGTRALIKEKPRQVTMFSASVAALLICAVLLVGLYQFRSIPMQTSSADQPPRIAEESYLPASYPPPPRKPESASAQAPPSVAARAAALLDKGDYSAAIELLEGDGASDTSAADPSTLTALRVRALVGRAAELKETSPRQAESLLRMAVRAAPENVETLMALGNQYSRARAYNLATDAYQKAIELNPRRADALFNLGFIFATTGKYISSEVMFSRAAQLKPDFADKALFNMAVVQEKLGKRQECLASLEAALAFRPDNAQARSYLKTLKAAAQDQP